MTELIGRSIGLMAVLGLLAAACNGNGSSPQASPETTPSQGTPTPTATEPASTPTPIPSPRKTSTCALDSTDGFREVQAEADFDVYCPTFLPPGFAMDSVVLQPGNPNAPIPQGPFLNAVFRDDEGGRITMLQGKLGADWRLTILTPFEGVTPESVTYGNLPAKLYQAPPSDELTLGSMILGISTDGADHFLAGLMLDVDLLRQVAAGMAQLE